VRYSSTHPFLRGAPRPHRLTPVGADSRETDRYGDRTTSAANSPCS